MGMLHSSGYVWWVERGKLAIGRTSDNGATVQPPATAGLTIRIYSKEVATIDNGSGTDIGIAFNTGTSISLVEFSKLPIQFHEALISKVMEKLYRKDPEGVALSQYWGQVYKDFVVKGIKYSNQGRIDSGFTVAQHDM